MLLFLRPLSDAVTAQQRNDATSHEPTCRDRGHGVISRPMSLRKFGYQLGPFGLRPGARGAGAHVSQRRHRKREFGDVIAERRFSK